MDIVYNAQVLLFFPKKGNSRTRDRWHDHILIIHMYNARLLVVIRCNSERSELDSLGSEEASQQAQLVSSSKLRVLRGRFAELSRPQYGRKHPDYVINNYCLDEYVSILLSRNLNTYYLR